jgi:hypothetical protein
MKRLIFQAKNAIVFWKPHEHWFFEALPRRLRTGEPNAGESNDQRAFFGDCQTR